MLRHDATPIRIGIVSFMLQTRYAEGDSPTCRYRCSVSSLEGELVVLLPLEQKQGLSAFMTDAECSCVSCVSGICAKLSMSVFTESVPVDPTRCR